MRPAFGLGEDWNYFEITKVSDTVTNCAQLSGWVRIGTELSDLTRLQTAELRPAFGLGEDWNSIFSLPIRYPKTIAPSFRAG